MCCRWARNTSYYFGTPKNFLAFRLNIEYSPVVRDWYFSGQVWRIQLVQTRRIFVHRLSFDFQCSLPFQPFSALPLRVAVGLVVITQVQTGSTLWWWRIPCFTCTLTWPCARCMAICRWWKEPLRDCWCSKISNGEQLSLSLSGSNVSATLNINAIKCSWSWQRVNMLSLESKQWKQLLQVESSFHSWLFWQPWKSFNQFWSFTIYNAFWTG